MNYFSFLIRWRRHDADRKIGPSGMVRTGGACAGQTGWWRYLSRTNLDAAFDDDGRQINPLTARLTGNVTGVVKLFNRCDWQAEPENGASLPHQFTLMVRQGVPGEGY